jgi:hypothetical protein
LKEQQLSRGLLPFVPAENKEKVTPIILITSTSLLLITPFFFLPMPVLAQQHLGRDSPARPSGTLALLTSVSFPQLISRYLDVQVHHTRSLGLF